MSYTAPAKLLSVHLKSWTVVSENLQHKITYTTVICNGVIFSKKPLYPSLLDVKYVKLV